MARLQLDLNHTSDALIDKLMKLCDLKTKKDVVENALMILGWAATESRNGLSIAAIDLKRSVYKEINTPALEGARGYDARVELVDAGGDVRSAGRMKLASAD